MSLKTLDKLKNVVVSRAQREVEAAREATERIVEIDRQIEALRAERDALVARVETAREARRGALRVVGDARAYIDELRGLVVRSLGTTHVDRVGIFLREGAREAAV